MEDLIKKDNENFLKKYKIKIIIGIIVLFGVLIRTIGIGSIPNALNVDEASAGFESYSILNYGIDRNGNFLPVFLVAWGSGQNALYTYLMMPFIAMFGLTTFAIRLPMAIIGGISLIVFYLLLKRMINQKTAIIGLIFLAICPWHIMKSRWGLESNLFPDLMLLSVFLIIKGIQDKKRIFQILGYIVAGLTAYAYGTSYFFLPLFFIPVLFIMLKKKEITVKELIINLAVIGIVALPIIIFVIINTFNLPEIELPFLTIPRMEVNRYEEITSIFSSDFLEKSLDNFAGGLKILMYQVDGLPWNSLEDIGTIYTFSTIFTILGIIVAIKNRKNIKYGYIMGIWLIVSILLLFVCEPNINRLNIIFFPIIFYTVVGIDEIAKQGKVFAVLLAIVYILSFGLFVNSYLSENANDYMTFESNLEEPIEYLNTLQDKEIYITNSIKEPYIYVLFYTKYDTRDFVDTVEYYNGNGAFRQVKSFGNYNFISINMLDDRQENVYLLRENEYEDVKNNPEKYGIDSLDGEFEVKEFLGYVVLEGKV